MKVFLPVGVIAHAHIYKPHQMTPTSPPTYMLVVEAAYLKDFPELEEFFKEPNANARKMVKISTRKRVEVKTGDIDQLVYAHKCMEVRNIGADRIFLEEPVIADIEVINIKDNPYGFSGKMLSLNGVSVIGLSELVGK